MQNHRDNLYPQPCEQCGPDRVKATCAYDEITDNGVSGKLTIHCVCRQHCPVCSIGIKQAEIAKQSVDAAEALAVLSEFAKDIETAYEDPVDLASMPDETAWPDLYETYKKAVALLERAGLRETKEHVGK